MFLLGAVAVLIILPAIILTLILLLYLIYSYRITGLDRKIRLLIFLFSALFFLAGAVRMEAGILRMEGAEDFYKGKEKGDLITIQGELKEIEYKNEKYRLYLKNAGADGINAGGVLVYFDRGDFVLGSILKVKGSFLPMNVAKNEGGFDQKKYLNSRGIYGQLSGEDVKILLSPKLSVKDYFYKKKISVMDFYKKVLPGEESGLLSAMVLGDKSELTAEAKALFSLAGLSHILAVSGLHLSLLGMGLFKILRKLKFTYPPAGIISLIFIIIYGLFAGNPVSLIRASVMFFMQILAEIMGKAYDSLNALSLSAFILVMANPFHINDAGFILSHLAVFSICFFASPISRFYEGLCKLRWEKIYRGDVGLKFKLMVGERAVGGILFSLFVSAGTAPAVAFFFGRIPSYVMILNLLVLPLLGVVLVLGLIGGLLELGILLIPCHFILYYYEALSDFVTKIPGSSLSLPTPGIYGILFYYLFLLGLTKLIFYLEKIKVNNRRPGFFILEGRALKIAKDKNKRGYEKYREITGIIKRLIISSLCGILILILFLKGQYPRGFRIDMLYVGQGDGIFIQSEENVRIFIDGGSSSEKEVGRNTILPYLRAVGADSVDYWIISHFDSDHYSGLLEVLSSGYPVGNLLLSEAVVKNEGFREATSLCKELGIRVSYLTPGEGVITKSMKIRALYPDAGEGIEDTNEASLCLFLSYRDFEAVFTGDLGSEGEGKLIESPVFKELARGRDIELIKAGHHGSKNSNCSEFLQAMDPEYVIISAGENNRYNHPSLEAIDRIESVGAKWLCTIERGRIRVNYIGGKMKAEGYLKP